ncbi:MAG: hypothetical protein IPP19_02845 [Verrucomicrobia bacterium]|nr:hypothetical protein [Verrucomicrobiota bacterium]
MKIITSLACSVLLLSGCARKSELEATREELVEAQRKIETLENERVSRAKYEAAQVSLKLADQRIAVLERELKLTQEQLIVQATAVPTDGSASQFGAVTAARSTTSGPTKGTYEIANGTHVYSADAELNFGQHLRISSPNGLMVSDPEHKVIGGDLSIKSKDMVMEAPDSLVTTAADGSVKFTGKTLTMKFNEAKIPQAAPTEGSLSSEPSQASGCATTTPESYSPPLPATE